MEKFGSGFRDKHPGSIRAIIWFGGEESLPVFHHDAVPILDPEAEIPGVVLHGDSVQPGVVFH
jgi:hypothetical protein